MPGKHFPLDGFSHAAELADNTDTAVTALIMGGTTQSTPPQRWIDATIRDYIEPALGTSCLGVAVTTPAKWVMGESQRAGLADLRAAMSQQDRAEPGRPYVVQGFSQSAMIAVELKRELAAAKAAGQSVPNVTLVLLGSANRPNGGVGQRVVGLYVPGMQVSGNGAEPTDAAIPTIDIAQQYDPAADFPQYPLNLVAVANVLLGAAYAHLGAYGNPFRLPGRAAPSLVGATFADRYVDGFSHIVKQTTGDTVFYLIPTAKLPLLDPLRILGVPESVIDIVQPALRVIVEAGYDRSAPLGQPTPAQLIPTTDPVTFTLALARALAEGANNVFALVGAQLPGTRKVEGLLAMAQSRCARVAWGYYRAASAINRRFNPITIIVRLEGLLGLGLQHVLLLTGVQRAINYVFGLPASGAGRSRTATPLADWGSCQKTDPPLPSPEPTGESA